VFSHVSLSWYLKTEPNHADELQALRLTMSAYKYRKERGRIGTHRSSDIVFRLRIIGDIDLTSLIPALAAKAALNLKTSQL
jgi:hypothetical protein